MRVLNSGKSNNSGSRLGVSLKTPKPYMQQPLSDLRKNLQGRNYVQQECVQQILKDKMKVSVKNMDLLMEKVLWDSAEDRFATVTGWTTVSISNCADISDESIMVALKWLLLPIDVDIFNFRRNWDEDNGSSGQFQVDSMLVANRLMRLQNNCYVLYSPKKIEMKLSDGLPQEVLNTVVNAAFVEAVLEAVKSRYDNTTHTLNLSRFHASPALANHFCPLHVEKFLETVLLAVRKALPKVRTIVLSNNYLCTLKAFESVGRFEALEGLDISFNKIKDLEELQYLIEYDLKRLFVAGNGVTKCNTKQFRSVLPTLENIHGCVLSNEKNFILPGPRRFQSADAKGPNFCMHFLTMYYNYFDEPENRSQLEQFYHGDAIFSLSVSEKLNFVPYRMYNRNHKSSQSTFARNAKLQHNSSAIILALSRLPRMQTDQQNISLDVLVYEANLRIFAITGCFTEKSVVGSHVRYFQRVFALRPLGNPGWTIVNDMLSIMCNNPKSKDSQVPLVSIVCIDDCGPMLSDPEEETKEVLELSLCMPKMAIESKETFEEMPPLVPIAKMVYKPEEDLENEIDETIVSDEDTLELVIDEDVLIGDDF